jgi:DNA polymerase-3 subunit epsilon
MSKVIALDIETTGLPERLGFDKYYDPNDINKYDKSRVVSIGLYSSDFEKYEIIRPNNFIIGNSEFHGITQEIADLKGISLQDFFNEETIHKLKDYEILVGHNINFDIHVLKSDLIRHNLSVSIFPNKIICTMQKGKSLLRQRKAPKLTELYQHLFKENYQTTHNALEDAKMSFLCFKKMCA